MRYNFINCVYILISLKDRCLYIGYCSNLKTRIKKHRKGFVKATKNRRPLKIIYYEAYPDRKSSLRREKYLKGGKGRKELKIQIREILEKYQYKYIN